MNTMTTFVLLIGAAVAAVAIEAEAVAVLLLMGAALVYKFFT